VRSARAAGLIDRERDAQQCVEDMVAPFLYRRLVTRQLITSAQVRRLAGELLERWA
jgi:hypothetical protein